MMKVLFFVLGIVLMIAGGALFVWKPVIIFTPSYNLIALMLISTTTILLGAFSLSRSR